MTNPEAGAFEKGVILAAIYGNHPIPIDWAHDTEGEGYPTENGHTRADIQFSTVRWLIAEDYIRAESGNVGGEWRELTLTEKGYNTLEEVPSDSPEKESLGKRLVASVKRGASDVTRRLVVEYVQRGFESFS